MRKGDHRTDGFSLVELLVVLAIIGLLSVLAVPAFNQTSRASKLATCGQMVVDELNLARQTAQSQNAPVEVRFYKLPDFHESTSAAPSVYCAVQSFLVLEGGSKPLNRLKVFPAPVILSPEASESAFLSSVERPEQPAETNFPLPGYGANYKFRYLRFMPSGATDLPSAENFFTLVLQNDKPLAEGANFFTVQINPLRGSIKSFRP